MYWTLSNNHKFYVKSFYGAFQGDHMLDIPWREIWKSKTFWEGCFLFFVCVWTAAPEILGLRLGFCCYCMDSCPWYNSYYG